MNDPGEQLERMADEDHRESEYMFAGRDFIPRGVVLTRAHMLTIEFYSRHKLDARFCLSCCCESHRDPQHNWKKEQWEAEALNQLRAETPSFYEGPR